MLRFFALYRAALQPSRCSVTLCLAVSTVARGGLLPDVIIPSDSADADANDISRLPFGYVCPQVVHYQQVYNAAAFSSVRPPGAFLTAIFFRGDCSASWVPVVTNLQVNLSITSKAADQLSALFAENPGADETVVFRGTNYIPTGHWSLPSCPEAPGYGNPIILDVPFYYDPPCGNLLLELQVSGVRPYCVPPDCQYPSWWTDGGPPYNKLDAATVPGDAVSRVAAFSLTANSAEVIDTTGLVTVFAFATTPTLTNRFETNTLILTWAAQPQPFHLQWTGTLGQDGAWADYSGPLGGGALYRVVTIPADSLASPKFFRLYWNTPQTFPAPPAGTVEQPNSTRKP